MIRVGTFKKEWALPNNPDLPQSAGIALEVDSYMPEAFLLGVNFHQCDICAYVSVHLVLVTLTFKLFVVKRVKPDPRCSCGTDHATQSGQPNPGGADEFCPVHGQDIR